MDTFDQMNRFHRTLAEAEASINLAVTTWVTQLLQNDYGQLRASTLELIKEAGLGSQKVEGYFVMANKYRAPKGMLRFLFQQSKADEEALEKLSQELKEALIKVAREHKTIRNSQAAAELKQAREGLRLLAERTAKATKTAASVQQSRSTVRSAPVVHHVTESVRTVHTSDSGLGLTDILILNSLLNNNGTRSNQDEPTAQVITSGQGGEFGGGGAGGGWVDSTPSVQQCTPDNLSGSDLGSYS